MTLACANLDLAVPGRMLCRDLSLHIEPGQVWGVLGANGSGKSTLLHTLAGLTQAAGGSVTLDGMALAALPAKSRARGVGLLMQHEQHAEAELHCSALDYVLLGRFPQAQSWTGWSGEDEDGARSALARAGIAAFAQRRYATLSGGERQRVRIAQLIAQSPRYWLLDEPLQHLDLAHQIETMALVTKLAREEGCAVVMVLHDLIWPARVCTHALLMHGDGNTAGGTSCEVLTQGNLEKLFGCALQALDGGNNATTFVPAL